jgi:hypothetical protein
MHYETTQIKIHSIIKWLETYTILLIQLSLFGITMFLNNGISFILLICLLITLLKSSLTEQIFKISFFYILITNMLRYLFMIDNLLPSSYILHLIGFEIYQYPSLIMFGTYSSILLILLYICIIRMNITLNCHHTINAVTNGDRKFLIRILNEQSILLTTVDKYSRTLLHLAAMNGHLSIVHLLTTNQLGYININAQDKVNKYN